MQKKAFSLTELSITITIIGFLILAIVSGKIIIDKVNLESARNLTKNSAILSIPNLALWVEPTLDESFLNQNLSNNDQVKTWYDLSGNGRNITQTDGAKQPKYITSGINRLPSLQFNGTNSFLTNSSGVISNGNSSYTMVAVWNQKVAGKSTILTQYDNSVCAGNSAGIMTEATAMVGNFACDNVIYNYTPALSKINTTNIAIVRIDKAQNTNQAQVYLNGVSQASNLASVGNLSGLMFGIGGAPTSATESILNFNGNISEVMVFDRALNASEINIINKYLNKKYFNITNDTIAANICSLVSDVQIGSVVYKGSTTSIAQGTTITNDLACAVGYGSTNGAPSIICNAGSGGASLSVSNGCTKSCASSSLTPPANSTNNSPEYTNFGSAANITCNVNFSGSPAATCGANGIWGTVSGSCVPNCTSNGFATILSNGHYTGTTSSYVQGTSVTLTCQTGYSGANSSTTCESGGNWSVPTACVQQCASSSLTPPANSTNNTAAYTNLGGSASIACNTGYLGSPTAICNANGIWGTVSGSCAEQCTIAGLNTKLSSTNSQNSSTPTYTNQGDAGSITCKSGYSATNGTPMITCGSGGVWNDVVNDCTPNCTVTANQPFGNSTYTRTSTTISVSQGWYDYTTCNSGYGKKILPDHTRQNSQPKITCGSGGGWIFQDDCEPWRDCWPQASMGYYNISGSVTMSGVVHCHVGGNTSWADYPWTTSINFLSVVNEKWITHNSTTFITEESPHQYCSWEAVDKWITYTMSLWCYDGTKYTGI